MITYKYSILEDIKAHYLLMVSLVWLKKHRIKVFYPNPWETLKLMVKQPKINYQCKQDITCYWVSAGTWGSYFLPSKIRVCPRQASLNFLKNTIKHEITHLLHEDKVRGMSHEKKEEYIESIT